MAEPVARIAAVPAAHPYVRAVRPPGHALLPDPPVPGAPAGRWWPPVVLGPAWLREHAGDYDLVHLHFGMEGRTPGELRAVLEELRELGRPVVHTVHDLEHPHLDDQSRHREHLSLLAARADALLTLTDAAADEVERRHGRRPVVVPHPQMAPDTWVLRADAERAPRPTDAPRVGVHLRSLRANVRPGAWLGRLADEVARRGGVTTAWVNDDVRPGTAAGRALHDLRTSTAGGPLEVRVRPRPDDDGLARELVGLDVSVLPYAHGTHSGWLELCWDLGVGVLTPDVGAFADQHHEPWAVGVFRPDRPGTLVDALDGLLAAPPAPPATERLAARAAVARRNHETHAAVYARVLGAVGAGVPHRDGLPAD